MQARQRDRDHGQPEIGGAVYRTPRVGGLPSGVAGEFELMRKKLGLPGYCVASCPIVNKEKCGRSARYCRRYRGVTV